MAYVEAMLNKVASRARGAHHQPQQREQQPRVRRGEHHRRHVEKVARVRAHPALRVEVGDCAVGLFELLIARVVQRDEKLEYRRQQHPEQHEDVQPDDLPLREENARTRAQEDLTCGENWRRGEHLHASTAV